MNAAVLLQYLWWIAQISALVCLGLLFGVSAVLLGLILLVKVEVKA